MSSLSFDWGLGRGNGANVVVTTVIGRWGKGMGNGYSYGYRAMAVGGRDAREKGKTIAEKISKGFDFLLGGGAFLERMIGRRRYNNPLPPDI